jgi:hypothetical protein
MVTISNTDSKKCKSTTLFKFLMDWDTDFLDTLYNADQLRQTYAGLDHTLTRLKQY